MKHIPLDGSFSLYILQQRSVKACRKDHVCSQCQKPIPKGTGYEYVVGLFEGVFAVSKLCKECLV